MWLRLSLLAVPILIGLNAFFVAAEYAVVAALPAVIESLRQRRRFAVASALPSVVTDPAGAIGAIQVCITMTNLLDRLDRRACDVGRPTSTDGAGCAIGARRDVR